MTQDRGVCPTEGTSCQQLCDCCSPQVLGNHTFTQSHHHQIWPPGAASCQAAESQKTEQRGSSQHLSWSTAQVGKATLGKARIRINFIH